MVYKIYMQIRMPFHGVQVFFDIAPFSGCLLTEHLNDIVFDTDLFDQAKMPLDPVKVILFRNRLLIDFSCKNFFCSFSFHIIHPLFRNKVYHSLFMCHLQKQGFDRVQFYCPDPVRGSVFRSFHPEIHIIPRARRDRQRAWQPRSVRLH